MILRLGRARDRYLAQRMKRFLTSDRIDDNRCRVARTEQRDARIYLVDVDQTSRPERPAIESFAICADGAIVVGARREVGPVSDGNVLVCDGLEIEDVERLVRRSNERRGLQSLLDKGECRRCSSRGGRGEVAKEVIVESDGGKNGASSDETEKLATMCDAGSD